MPRRHKARRIAELDFVTPDQRHSSSTKQSQYEPPPGVVDGSAAAVLRELYSIDPTDAGDDDARDT